MVIVWLLSAARVEVGGGIDLDWILACSPHCRGLTGLGWGLLHWAGLSSRGSLGLLHFLLALPHAFGWQQSSRQGVVCLTLIEQTANSQRRRTFFLTGTTSSTACAVLRRSTRCENVYGEFDNIYGTLVKESATLHVIAADLVQEPSTGRKGGRGREYNTQPGFSHNSNRQCQLVNRTRRTFSVFK